MKECKITECEKLISEHHLFRPMSAAEIYQGHWDGAGFRFYVYKESHFLDLFFAFSVYENRDNFAILNSSKHLDLESLFDLKEPLLKEFLIFNLDIFTKIKFKKYNNLYREK